MNFWRTAFAVSHRFCIVVFSLLFFKIFWNSLFDFITDPLIFFVVAYCLVFIIVFSFLFCDWFPISWLYSHHLSVILAVGFVGILTKLRKFRYITNSFAKFFFFFKSWMGVRFCQILCLHILIWSCDFSFLVCEQVTLPDFEILCQPCLSGINTTWIVIAWCTW